MDIGLIRGFGLADREAPIVRVPGGELAVSSEYSEFRAGLVRPPDGPDFLRRRAERNADERKDGNKGETGKCFLGKTYYVSCQ
jgi:hypothetical protein